MKRITSLLLALVLALTLAGCGSTAIRMTSGREFYVESLKVE